MYINVTVVMRYTHRHDDHLQGVPLGPKFQRPQVTSMWTKRCVSAVMSDTSTAHGDTLTHGDGDVAPIYV